jgi:hypothetical protein
MAQANNPGGPFAPVPVPPPAPAPPTAPKLSVSVDVPRGLVDYLPNVHG